MVQIMERATLEKTDVEAAKVFDTLMELIG